MFQLVKRAFRFVIDALIFIEMKEKAMKAVTNVHIKPAWWSQYRSTTNKHESRVLLLNWWNLIQFDFVLFRFKRKVLDCFVNLRISSNICFPVKRWNSIFALLKLEEVEDRGLENDLRPGSFEVESGMSMDQLMDIIF